jgi:hypothetical protein
MKTRLAFGLAVVALSLACQRESAAPEVAAPGQATAETIIATEDASTAVLDVKIPLTVNAVARCEPAKTTFAMNEPVALTLELTEVPDGLQVAARILDKNERLVARTSEAANGRKSITLTVKGEVPEPGTYKLEGLWGGNIVCEHPIEFKR